MDSGKEKAPKDAIDAMTLMRKCYAQVSKEPDKKTAVATDTGVGEAKVNTTRKSGKLQDVLADMKKDTSWKT